MNGNNARFLADPAGFLRTKGLNFKGMIRNSKVGDFNGIVGEQVVEFDLVPINAQYVEMTVLGGTGTYAGTKRRGAPIVGHFLHWNGQTYKSGCETFGSLNLSACTADYVFTAPFTGCCFVVIQLHNGGGLRVYHEPTEDSRNCVYPGNEVMRCGPDYSGDGGASGNGVLVRRAGGWRAIIAERGFGAKTATVTTHDF